MIQIDIIEMLMVFSSSQTRHNHLRMYLMPKKKRHF